MTMQQKILPPEFGEDESTPFKNDLLKREDEIKILTPMITTRIVSPATMAIDAEWGAGKTAFIKMWKAHLNNEASARAFYFNAWETDFAADPLVPFVETITAEIKGKNQKLIESTKTLSLAIGGVVGRAAGAGVVVDVTEKAAKHLFAPRSELKQFKDALGKFVASQDKRVVIFVDELDRCRPDYAVKVLERIKHLFEVPGVIFVLATNRAQLCHSINALYGEKFDAETYLRRFIEFDYTIKAPDMGAFIAERFKDLEIDKFLISRQVMPEMQNDADNFHAVLKLLAEIYNFSLRDMEQLIIRIVLVIWALEDTATEKYPIYPILLAFLVVARLKMPGHYRRYINPNDNGEEIIAHWEKHLKEDDIYRQRRESSIAAHITGGIVMAKFFALENTPRAFEISDLIKSYKKKAAQAIPSEKRYCEILSSLISLNRHDQIHLREIVNKIEMLDRFRFLGDDNSEGGGN